MQLFQNLSFFATGERMRVAQEMMKKSVTNNIFLYIDSTYNDIYIRQRQLNEIEVFSSGEIWRRGSGEMVGAKQKVK